MVCNGHMDAPNADLMATETAGIDLLESPGMREALELAVGTLGGYNLFSVVIEDSDARFVFPWSQMLVIGAGVWVASLLFTIVPAVRASRIPPVEALR